jgi:2-oxoglutarate dehydrogenase E2 component (dihydrolipoamide succinyltransferase)
MPAEPVPVLVPSPGESVTEVVIGRWLKPSGAFVKAGDPLFEVESDKATLEGTAPADGTLTQAVPEGATVAVKSVAGTVQPGAAPAAAPAPPSAAPTRAAPEPRPAPPAEAVLSPAARQLVADHGLDAARLTGSGRGGRVLKEDVLAALESKTAPAPREAPRPAPAPAAVAVLPPPEANGERETRQRMSAVRARIAERLLAAQQSAAILTTFNEADLSAVMALRAKYKDGFQKKHGVGLGFMSFFVKAVVEALRAFPNVNARVDGGDIVYHHFCNVGVAVSTDRGLMVPVLRDADRLSFADIEKGIAALAARAREGKITVDDLQSGTFTITNGGVFGSLLSTPILNPPQSGILGMHAIQKRPVAVGDQVEIRPMMYLALSYDHRIIDGREAVSFLVRVKECVEAPERLLLEV